MPNYNSTLQSNNTDLQAILNSINELTDEDNVEVDCSNNENAIVAKTLSVYFNDRVTTIGDYAFYYCRSLTSASLPRATTIGNSAFGYCYSLTSVSLPRATTIGNEAFYNCAKLTSVSLPMATTIGNYAFGHCDNLKSLYLTGSSLCKLSNSNAFQFTPYAGYYASFSGTPYIYVPASLVDSYKTATNWTYFSNYFSAIGSIVNLS